MIIKLCWSQSLCSAIVQTPIGLLLREPEWCELLFINLSFSTALHFYLPLWNTTCKEEDIIINLFIQHFFKDLLQATTVILIVSLFSGEKPQGRLRVICFVFLKTYSWHGQKTLSTAEINFKQSGWYYLHLHTLGLLYSLSLTETHVTGFPEALVYHASVTSVDVN